MNAKRRLPLDPASQSPASSPSFAARPEDANEDPGDTNRAWPSPKRRLLSGVSVKDEIRDVSDEGRPLLQEGRPGVNGPASGRPPRCPDASDARQAGDVPEPGLPVSDTTREASGRSSGLGSAVSSHDPLEGQASFLSASNSMENDGDGVQSAAVLEAPEHTEASGARQGGDSCREASPDGQPGVSPEAGRESLSPGANGEKHEGEKEAKQEWACGSPHSEQDVDAEEERANDEDEASEQRNADTGFALQDFYDFSEDIAALMGVFVGPQIEAIEAEAVAETVRLCLGFIDDAVARGLFVASTLNSGLHPPALLPRPSAAATSPGRQASPSQRAVASPALVWGSTSPTRLGTPGSPSASGASPSGSCGDRSEGCMLLAEHFILAFCNTSQRKYQRCRQVLETHRQIQSLLTAYDDTLISSVNPIYHPATLASSLPASRSPLGGEAGPGTDPESTPAVHSGAASKGGKGRAGDGKKEATANAKGTSPAASHVQLPGGESTEEEPSTAWSGGDVARA